MKSFKEYLLEGKQVGTLYHFTGFYGLEKILETNSLKEGGDDKDHHYCNGISFTRDKNFHSRVTATGVPSLTRITLNGTKLSQNYKIGPFHDYKYFGRKSAQQGIDEMEEKAFTKKIDNITQYIQAVNFLIPNLYIHTCLGNNADKYIKDIKTLCDNYNIPLYDYKDELVN